MEVSVRSSTVTRAKLKFTYSCSLTLVVAWFAGAMPPRLSAQIFTVLHTFVPETDGANARSGLICSGNTLYGTAQAGGNGGVGCVFRINADGTGFTNMHNFGAVSGPMSTNSDGANPTARLLLSGNTLYGTTDAGGVFGGGTIFSLNTDGSGFTTLYAFAYQAYKVSELVLSSNVLYGTTDLGGDSTNGSVFALHLDDTKVFTNIYSFTPLYGNVTNADGSHPVGGLAFSAGTLYGTTLGGGSHAVGTIFAVNIDGGGFRKLHDFSGPVDGGYPNDTLILSGNTLFGTTSGAFGTGTVFKVNTDGSGFTNLYNFSGGNDGLYPFTTLVRSGNTLYGTANSGGEFGEGTLYAVGTDGTGFRTLYSFSAATGAYPSTNSDGFGPAALAFSESTLYGTAIYGGDFGVGTLFSVSLPKLNISLVGTNVILAWPTNSLGVGLRSSTNLNIVPGPVWVPVSPSPIITNGENTVTNPVSARQMFYRLSL